MLQDREGDTHTNTHTHTYRERERERERDLLAPLYVEGTVPRVFLRVRAIRISLQGH